jgi:hypothetical protein
MDFRVIDLSRKGSEIDSPSGTRGRDKRTLKNNNSSANFLGAGKGAAGTLDDLKNNPPITHQ